jgi:porin
MLDVHTMRPQRVFFLNSGVTDNPAVPFPSSALAGILMVRPAETVKIKFALSDADSRQLRETGDSDRFFKDYFAAAQVGWTPRVFDRGESLLQAMYWHRSSAADPTRPDGDGVSLLAQRRWEGNGTAFLRYSYSSSEVTAVSHMVATGGGISPFPQGRPDLAGLSLAWGQPSVAGLRDQYVIEAFYRLQLTPEFQLTPDVQFIVDPSFNTAQDLIVVFGLRARLIL